MRVTSRRKRRRRSRVCLKGNVSPQRGFGRFDASKAHAFALFFFSFATDPTSYSLSLALIFLLLSTSYDTRQTLGDPTLESPWTLTALTPLFTSLVTPPPRWTLTDVVRSSYRRMLAFPLYRSWALAEKVRQDVADVLKGGRRSVARTLLGMRRVLLGGEGYDVWVKVWVGEMCGWIVSGGVR